MKHSVPTSANTARNSTIVSVSTDPSGVPVIGSHEGSNEKEDYEAWVIRKETE